jgi:hypothetical protein
MTTNNELLGYQGATGDFFENLQERYGSTLQRIHVDDKFVILSSIFAYHLIGEGGTMEDAWQLYDPDNDSNPAVFEILNGLEEFDPDRQFAFALAVLNQVRESYRLQVQFQKQLENAGVQPSLAQEVSVILANGGDRTQAQCELVSEAWEQVFKTDKRLAARMDAAMGVEG